MMKTAKVLFSVMAAGLLTAPATFAAAKAPVKAAPAKAAVKTPAPAKTAPVNPMDVFKALPAVVAEYNGKKVTRDDIAKFCLSQFPEGKLPQDFNAEAVKGAAYFLAKAYVNNKLMEAAMAKAGVKPSEAAAKKVLMDEIKKVPKAQLEMMTKQLAMQGTTIEKYIAKLAADKNVQLQLAQKKYAEDTFLKNIQITEQDAKAFYTKNQQMFKSPADPKDAMRASHILIMCDAKADAKTKAKALKDINDILKAVKANPAKFAEIAAQKSACPSGKRGGSLGAFQKGQMVPEFEKATLALKPGQISGVVKTNFGYHIIRRDALQQSVVQPFATVKPHLMQMLKAQKMQRASLDFMNALEKQAKVKYLVSPPQMPQMMPMGK